jgi:putative methionine-R-sulfoxide reductase with GAF domain
MNNWFSQFLAQTPEQGRNAVRLAIAFMGAAFLATLVFAYVAVQNGSWQAYAVVAGFVGFFIFQAFVIRAARRSQFNTAGFLLVAAVCYIVLVMVTFMAGIGWGLSIALAMVVIEIALDTLSGVRSTRARVAGISFAALVLLLDYLAPWSRPLFPAVQYAIPAIAGGTVIMIGLLTLGRLGVWQNLSLSRKLLVAFGGLLILSLAIAASGLIGLNRVETAYENTLAGGVDIERQVDHFNGRLLEARRREKDFLLRWQVEGYDVAFANYAVVNREHIFNMRETLEDLGALAPTLDRSPLGYYSRAQYESDLALLDQDLTRYEESFISVTNLLRQRGYLDTGLEGELRTSVQAIEAKINNLEGAEKLVITLLQVRRNEKDYLLRGDQQYVDNVRTLIAQLKDQAAASELLGPAEKAEINGLADDYLDKFDQLVTKDVEVEAAIEALRTAAAELQTVTARVESAGEDLALLDIQTAETNVTQTNTITILVLIIAIILSVVLALVLARQITNPVLILTDVAQQLEAGNFDAHVEVTSGDEIGTLASTFNGMAAQIKKALATVAQRAAELQTVAEVSASTSTVLDTDKLLWNVSNLTKERFNLYHAHIYIMNSAGDTLVLAAGAGEAGRKMVAEGRSIPLDREQSLVARSARERRGVIVNNVSAAPDFLPNPLLPDTRSELAVPMVVNDQVVGVFDIQSDQLDRFTQENADIQTTLAAQIAIAVQNARSYSEVQARAEREALIASIGQKIQNTSTVENALQVAVRELGRALSKDARVVLKTSDNGSQN